DLRRDLLSLGDGLLQPLPRVALDAAQLEVVAVLELDRLGLETLGRLELARDLRAARLEHPEQGTPGVAPQHPDHHEEAQDLGDDLTDVDEIHADSSRRRGTRRPGPQPPILPDRRNIVTKA